MEQLKNILFIDIETAPCVPEFNLLSEGMQEQWKKKTRLLRNITEANPDPAMLFTERAGVFSEFSQVVCIGLGCIIAVDGEEKFLLKSLIGDDEKALLNQFCSAASKFMERFVDFKFCGHNIREFDLPFICRRMIINGISLPDCLQFQGKKPWEITHIDTLELWKFGDYKNYTSLALLAEVLGITSPKDDIDGSMVGEVYWQERNLARISHYCLKDVYTTAKVFMRLKGITEALPEEYFVNE